MEVEAEHPALPALMGIRKDRFIGTAKINHRPASGLKGRGACGLSQTENEAGHVYGGRPPSPCTGRMMQEWLEEAKKMVTATPYRHFSPVHSAGQPRFAAASQANENSPMKPPTSLDRRDALSRSARRNRSIEGISDEILQRSSARHSRNKSEVQFPAADSHSTYTLFDELDGDHHNSHRFFPNMPLHPKPRFQEKASDVPPRRSFRTPLPSSRTPVPLPPEKVPHQPRPLSPPRIPLESSRRKSFSSPTCSNGMVSASPRPRMSFSGVLTPDSVVERSEDVKKLNLFLSRQKDMITRVSEGEVSTKAKLILSSYSPNTSSMVAAICYAWLLEHTRGRERSGIQDEIVVPVINMRREKMWECKQAAWLFHHIGIDASALIFSDELDYEGLLMDERLSLLVVGQDVLRTNGEVGSLCTILTDNFCENAYNLLQAPCLKRLLLAGILLDTHNLNLVAKSSTNKDAEAVQLLLVGSFPNFKDFFFEQVIKNHGEYSFLEALRLNYGKPSIEVKQKSSTVPAKERTAAQLVPGLPPTPIKATEKSCRPKNKFSVSKLLGFGSK